MVGRVNRNNNDAQVTHKKDIPINKKMRATSSAISDVALKRIDHIHRHQNSLKDRVRLGETMGDKKVAVFAQELKRNVRS